MHASDDKRYPLAQTKRPLQPRRAVSKKDFRLPRPYRRQLFNEEPERLTRLQVGMLAFSGLTIATLLAVFALMAQESERSPEGKVIVAAARLEPVETAEAELVSYSAPVAQSAPPLPPALQPGVPTAPAFQAATVQSLSGKTLKNAKPKAKPPIRLAYAPKQPWLNARAKAILAAREKKLNPPRKQAVPTAPAPDPDVALIAAILLLTPAPIPTTGPAVAMELSGRVQGTCAPAMASEHDCAGLHKLKP